MAKIKKFNAGDEVKVTQLPYMGKPSAPPENEYSEINRIYDEQKAKGRVEKDSLAPYEKKSSRISGRGGMGGSGGGGLAPVKGITGNPNFDMKKGGKVKSASNRADGCAVRGKTRA